MKESFAELTVAAAPCSLLTSRRRADPACHRPSPQPGGTKTKAVISTIVAGEAQVVAEGLALGANLAEVRVERSSIQGRIAHVVLSGSAGRSDSRRALPGTPLRSPAGLLVFTDSLCRSCSARLKLAVLNAIAQLPAPFAPSEAQKSVRDKSPVQFANVWIGVSLQNGSDSSFSD